jgi:uncharacterized membrane protein YozB (DUF420 family)
MSLPLGVIAFYGALVVWAALLITGLRKRAFGTFLGFGVVLLVVLNGRYAIDGAANSIAFFIGIYDVLDNAGLSDAGQAAALATCPDNLCSVWGDRFTHHPSWGVAFHERFSAGNAVRNNLLYGHIFFNTLAFVLMMVQLFRPGTGARARSHRTLGYASLGSLVIGVLCACLLAAEHGSVGHYGGQLSTWGFWFMGACVLACALMGLVFIRRRDFQAHRRWMFRYAGSMWGAFWLFRVMEFVLGPLLRQYDTASILICIWFSAPLGVLLAEFIRRRLDRQVARPVPGVARQGALAG